MKFIQFEQTVGNEERGKGRFLSGRSCHSQRVWKAGVPLHLICFSLKRNTWLRDL